MEGCLESTSEDLENVMLQENLMEASPSATKVNSGKKTKTTKALFGFLKCLICKKQFTDKYSLQHHIQLHSDTLPFECHLCPHRSKTKKYLSKHVKVVHSKRTKNKCEVCGKMFHYKSGLVNHMRTHTGEKPYKCEVCDKTFSSTYSLSTHRYIHTDEKPYKCSFCEYACRDTSTLRKHQDRHMGIEKIYQCVLCDKKCKSKSQLKMHVAEKHFAVDVKKFSCEICEKRFKEKSHLTNHVESVHEKSRSVKCEICGVWSSNKSNLSLHMLTHVDIKAYKCTFRGCRKRYKDQQTLKRHTLIHYPEQQLPCKVCGKLFTRRVRLNKHMLQHKPKIKNVECQHCGVLFYNETYLAKHIKQKHAKARQKFICDLCDFMTHNKPSIVMHLKYGHQTGNALYCKICKKRYKRDENLNLHFAKCSRCLNVPKLPKMTNTERPFVVIKQELEDLDEDLFVEVKTEKIEVPDYEEIDVNDMTDLNINDLWNIDSEHCLNLKDREINQEPDCSYLKRTTFSDNNSNLSDITSCDMRQTGLISSVSSLNQHESITSVPIDSDLNIILPLQCINSPIDLDNNQPVDMIAPQTDPNSLNTTKNISEHSTEQCRNQTISLNVIHSNVNSNSHMNLVQQGLDQKILDPNLTDMEANNNSKENTDTGQNVNDVITDSKHNQAVPRNKSNTNLNSKPAHSRTDFNELNAPKIYKYLNEKLDENVARNIIEHNGMHLSKIPEKVFDEFFIKHIMKIPEEETRADIQTYVNLKPKENTKKCVKKLLNNVKKNQEAKTMEQVRQQYNERLKKVSKCVGEKDKLKVKLPNTGRIKKKRLKRKSKNNERCTGHVNRKNWKTLDMVQSEENDDNNDSDYIEEVEPNKNKGGFKLNTHQCYVCFKLFETKEKLLEHCKEHFDVCSKKTLKKCPLCEYVTGLSLRRHMLIKHKINMKFYYTTFKDKEQNSKGSRYYYDINDSDISQVEIIPSIKNLNKHAYMKIDKQNREKKDKSVAKTKLVRKGNEWIVENVNVDLNIGDYIIPEIDKNDIGKVNDNNDDSYLEKMKRLSVLSKKNGTKMLFPCENCDKICQTLSALKLHTRRHDPNARPFKKKVWKHKMKDKPIENAQKTKQVVINTEHRFSKPKPIVNRHKCDPQLIEFYENNIKGSDIEFWQFLKIYNKMGRENIKDFSDLEGRIDFGIHTAPEIHTASETQSNSITKDIPSASTPKESLKVFEQNPKEKRRKMPKKKERFKKCSYKRIIRISKRDYIKRNEIKMKLREKNRITQLKC